MKGKALVGDYILRNGIPVKVVECYVSYYADGAVEDYDLSDGTNITEHEFGLDDVLLESEVEVG